MKKLVFNLVMILAICSIFSISANAQTKVSTGEAEEKVSNERVRFETSSKYPISSSGSYAISSGDGYVFFNDQGGSSSQLSLSKNFVDESKKNEGSFNVDESVKNINLMLSGSVKSGKILIIITLPDGKAMKEMTIDESADIQFNQNIRIAKDEEKYFGKWTYTVESVKATGKYRLSINSN